jgi:aminoglycoside phosphotransferase (APT) family kinase protein
MKPATCQEELTRDWLAHALDCSPDAITDLEVRTEEAEAGFVSLICFLDIQSHPDSGLPSSLVAKFAPTFAAAKEIVEKYGTFQREVEFYSKVAPRIPVRTPRLHFGHHDRESGLGVLLMEDCSGYRALSQVEDEPTTPDEFEQIVKTLAGMHAASWEAPWLDDIETLMGPGDDASWTAYFQDIQQSWKEFLDSDLINDVPELRPLAERLAESMVALTHDAMPRTKNCLAHLDYRLDNIFLDPESVDPVVLFDWQSMYRGRGAQDMGYLLATCHTVDFRRTHEEDLMRIYHQELMARGVTDYSFEEAWADYQHGILIGLRVVPMLVSTLDVSSERAQQLVSKITTGLSSAALDHGGTELLDRILAG